MAEKPTISYQRLPGTGYRQIASIWVVVVMFFIVCIFALLLRGRRTRLFLGPDHLLMVEWDGTREYYKRFRYEEIQMISVQRTVDGRIFNGLFALPIILFLAFALGASDPGWRIVSSTIAVVFGVMLFINFAKGPTCRCALQTAVQIEQLPSLHRLRNARQALAQLRPLLETAQGTLAPTELAAHLANPPEVPPVMAHRLAAATPAPPTPYRSKVHLIFFSLLIADLPISIVGALVQVPEVTLLVNTVFYLTLLGFFITALVKQQDTDLPRAIKLIPWATLIYFVLAVIVGFALLAAGALPEDGMGLMLLSVGSSLGWVALGAFGLVQLRRFRATQFAAITPLTPPPPATPPTAAAPPAV